MISILINIKNRSNVSAIDDFTMERINLPLYPNMIKSLYEAMNNYDGKYELLVCDWHSTDANVEDLTKQYFKDAIVYQHDGTFDRSVGKNFLASKAKGDRLLFLDADMLIPDDFFEKIDYEADAQFFICKYIANPVGTIITKFKTSAKGNMMIRKDIFNRSQGFKVYGFWGKEDGHFYYRMKLLDYYKTIDTEVDGLYHQWHPTNVDWKDKETA